MLPLTNESKSTSYMDEPVVQSDEQAAIDALHSELDELRQKILAKKTQLDANYLPTIASNTTDNHADRQFAKNLSTRKLLTGHYGKVACLDWTYDSQNILSCGQDGKLLLWNAWTTYKTVAIPLKTVWPMACCHVKTMDQICASAGLDDICNIFNYTDKSGWTDDLDSIELKKHGAFVSDCEFVPNKINQIVTSSGDSDVILWDIEKKQDICTFTKHKDYVMALDIHPINNNVILSGGSCTYVWDARTAGTDSTVMDSIAGYGLNLGSGMHRGLDDLKWFPDGNGYISTHYEQAHLYDVKACQVMQTYGDLNSDNMAAQSSDVDSGSMADSEVKNRQILSVDISQSGKYLFVGYDMQPFCLCYDIVTGEKIASMEHSERITSVVVAPDGYSVATGCYDKNVRVWA